MGLVCSWAEAIGFPEGCNGLEACKLCSGGVVGGCGFGYRPFARLCFDLREFMVAPPPAVVEVAVPSGIGFAAVATAGVALGSCPTPPLKDLRGTGLSPMCFWFGILGPQLLVLRTAMSEDRGQYPESWGVGPGAAFPPAEDITG